MAPPEAEKDALLSRRSYDADATEYAADREPRSDDEESIKFADLSDDLDEVFEDDYENAPETSSRLQRGLRGLFSRGTHAQDENADIPLQEKSRRQGRRPSRRHRERLKRGETDSELVYDMEEGGQASQSPSRTSSEIDLQRTPKADNPAYRPGRSRIKKVSLHIAIIAFFIALLYGAYTATRSDRQKQEEVKLALTLSNGTSLFAPTTILISLDGFRADFLQRGLTPTLNKFIQEGVSPLYMLPSFPSVTFPNHYTMVTGLYPEAHGIVGNSFWDPNDESEFYYTHPQQSLQGKWWGGEPVWLTAELQNVRAAVHMWPGSEANIGDVPTSHVDKYNGKEELGNKVDRILSLLDLPGPDSPHANADDPRPQLIAAYVPNVDQDGHNYGPNSTEIRQTIRDADDMLGNLFKGLQDRNLTNIVNVIVVSDHGMATTSTDRVVQLEDLLDADEIAHVDGWPLFGLRLKDPSKTKKMYNHLKKKTKDMPHLQIYLRDEDMPERYHFSKNPRIAPLWIVPDAGWAIAPKKEFNVKKAKKESLIYHPRGLHGYDFENSLMRAIFVARGPAFPHAPGSRIDNFQNTELYNIVCDTLGITPAPNNGTLRLPLRPIGHHTEIDAPQIETPYDPPPVGVGAIPTPTPSVVIEPIATVSATQIVPSSAAESSPIPSTSAEDSQEHKSKLQNWADWITKTLNDLKNGVKHVLNKVKGKQQSDNAESQ